jgi:hypothetical protein
VRRQFPHFPQFPLPRLRKVIAHAVKAWSGDRAIKFVFRNFRNPASAPKTSSRRFSAAHLAAMEELPAVQARRSGGGRRSRRAC